MDWSDLAIPDAVDRDSLFRALGNARRRYALAYLSERDGSVARTALTYGVARMEKGLPLDAISHEFIERVYVSLRHVHLPHLASADLAVYDREADVAALTAHARQFADLLRALTETPPSVDG